MNTESAAATKLEKGWDWSNRLRSAVIIIAILNLALTIRRLVPIFFPWNPDLMPVVTSGCEEEALFSIWKFTRGEPVYSDPSALPYAVSYFNWLFYFLYGTLTKLCLSAFALSDAWIPIITRSITLGIVAACVGVTSAIVREAQLLPASWGRTARLALVSLFYCNDLFGDWIVTTRPDLGALLGDLLALWFALRYLREGKLWALCMAVLCCYAAWAFKYNFVAVITGLCLTLMVTGRRRELVFVVSATFLLYGLTFGFGGSLYHLSILAPAGQSKYSFDQVWYVFKRTFDLAPHLAIVAAALFGTIPLRRNLPWDPNRLLLLFAIIISWGLMLSGATKRGADYNYFFEPSIFGALWLMNLYQAQIPEPGLVRWIRTALPLLLFAMSAVTAQKTFVAAVDWHNHARAKQAMTPRLRQAAETRPEWTELHQSLAALPGPVLITERRYNLPWIQSQRPHFVVAYYYASDRARGRAFERGGLAGLVRDGYFNTIVTTTVPSTNEHMTVAATATKLGIDGQALDGYELHHIDRYFEYYVRRSSNRRSQFSTR